MTPRVCLAPLRHDQLEQLRSWRNDPEIMARTREYRFLTEADQERWWQRITGPDRRDFMFGVLGPSLELVGVVGLCDWHPVNCSAEVSFYVGHQDYRNKGVCTAALHQLHAYGFETLGLHRIWAECYETNTPGLRLLHKLGYQDEGRLRDHVWRGGRWVTSVMLGLLEEDWRATQAG